jgi:hypothetical protein
MRKHDCDKYQLRKELNLQKQNKTKHKNKPHPQNKKIDL